MNMYTLVTDNNYTYTFDACTWEDAGCMAAEWIINGEAGDSENKFTLGYVLTDNLTEHSEHKFIQIG